MQKPILTPYCPTGIYPAWISVNDAQPNNARCVLATDGEGVHLACCCRYEPGGDWAKAETDDPFDSVITHWMEAPSPPEV